jgi:hypothetical protein
MRPRLVTAPAKPTKTGRSQTEIAMFSGGEGSLNLRDIGQCKKICNVAPMYGQNTANSFNPETIFGTLAS